MKLKRILPFFLILFVLGCQQGVNYENDSVVSVGSRTTLSGNKPFPHQFVSDRIHKPKHKSQTDLNNDVRQFYNYWKGEYVRRATRTKDGNKWGYVVLADYTGPIPDDWKAAGVDAKSHSEANGYGMIISALMGDKEVFDGLYIMYNNNRSKINGQLMSWIIPETEDPSLSKSTSATDGDMDIAYALLLADNQWGSDGYFDYKEQAMIMIEAIKASLFNHDTMRTTRGDWDDGGSSDKYSSRASDWLVAEFATFYDYTKDNFWTDAIDEIYDTIDEMLDGDSKATHLMPDFIEGIPAKKATSPFLECEADDDYAWNACRYPWRVGMGYGHYGDNRSKAALDGLVDWAYKKCGGSIWDYYAGYALDGSQIGKISWDPNSPYYKKHTNKLIDFSSNAFYSPLILAATHSNKYQTFINESWDIMIREDDWNTFFGDTITMQCLLYISGNWWIPEDSSSTAPTTPTNFKGSYNSSTKKVKLTWDASSDDTGIRMYHIINETVQISHAFWEFDQNQSSYELYIDTPYFDENEKFYDFQIRAIDDDDNSSEFSDVVRVYINNNAQIPPDPNASSKPSNFTLAKDKWNGESTYNIKANMWWGQNATVVKLYENGTIVDTQYPSFATPSAQSIAFGFSNKPKGTYVYRMEAINQHGITTTSDFTYIVSK